MAVESEPQLTARVEGKLHLQFIFDEKQQTRLLKNIQQPPLKVIRAFPLEEGGALVHLHNVSGGVLGGDQLTLDVDIGSGAHVQLTTTSATRVYRSRPGAVIAQQKSLIRVREGALLEYIPDPLIPFAGSRYRQLTHIELEQDAGLFWWEIVAPGRTARGELFAYDMLEMGMELTVAGRPFAIERMRVEPARQQLSSLVRMGSYTYLSSFYICRVGVEAARWSQLERALSERAQQMSRPGEILWGVSTLVAHGLLVRALSVQGRDILAGLVDFWRKARLALYGREAILPRKIY